MSGRPTAVAALAGVALLLPAAVGAQQGTETRTAGGAPGHAYWQNRADYRIEARLDAASHVLTGREWITYTNNSPDTLRFVWVQLDQNVFRAGSLAHAGIPPGTFELATTDGYVLSSVRAAAPGDGAAVDAPYAVRDTRMRVDLPTPLAPSGGQVVLEIGYSFTVPGENSMRMGWMESEHGPIYELAQWYPRMAVYDDVRGWNTLPYLGSGEFYLDYGDVEYTVDVPADMIVVGSGELQNPEDVLTAEQRDRLARARTSDETVMIRTVAEVQAATAAGARGESGARKRWRFTMRNTRDVAWAASRAFVWDAAKIDLPGGRKSLAMSAYPPESAGAEKWTRSTEFVKASVEQFSRDLYPYPWPAAINVAGAEGGMEYPGIVFCYATAEGAGLWSVTNHEIGHEWFPMIVGSDERRHAWMDEGFNTFVDIYASEAFNGGEFAPKRDGEYAPKGGNPAREIVPLFLDPDAPPIDTPADAITERYRHPVSYYKPALGLVILRQVILGPERFDRAFRTYVARWAYRHPRPVDFFQTMNDVTGEDLDWFWTGWFEENRKIDQAVSDVAYVDGDPANGALVTVQNLGDLAMPTRVRGEQEGGGAVEAVIPVQAWARGDRFVVRLDSTKPLASVTVDPDEQLPDVHPENDRWTPSD
ncbi:MAG: M1 family metallopeptidase [Gemmatimonadales bacterium]|jgi:hypothetical protein